MQNEDAMTLEYRLPFLKKTHTYVHMNWHTNIYSLCENKLTWYHSPSTQGQCGRAGSIVPAL